MAIEQNWTTLSVKDRLALKKNERLFWKISRQSSLFLVNAPESFHPLCMTFATFSYSSLLKLLGDARHTLGVHASMCMATFRVLLTSTALRLFLTRVPNHLSRKRSKQITIRRNITHIGIPSPPLPQHLVRMRIRQIRLVLARNSTSITQDIAARRKLILDLIVPLLTQTRIPKRFRSQHCSLRESHGVSTYDSAGGNSLQPPKYDEKRNDESKNITH